MACCRPWWPNAFQQAFLSGLTEGEPIDRQAALESLEAADFHGLKGKHATRRSTLTGLS
jgi:hypothetical protein